MKDELYQGYLAKVYQNSQGYLVYSPEDYARFHKEQICITYGELLYYGVEKILHILKLKEEDVFLDLGSGLGKTALQVFMKSDCNKVLGIEGSQVLHQQALCAIEEVKTQFPFFWENQRSLDLLCGNFLSTAWQDATVVYSCSTCFSSELLAEIGNRVNIEEQIKKVVSLRPLPTLKMPLKKVFSVECSWDTSLCFYYGE